MPGELKHASVGTELTQAEWEAAGAHVLDSQAQGDVVIANGASGVKRLAAGTAGQVLTTHGAGADATWETPTAGAGAGIAGGVGGAVTSDVGAWYIYRAATGAYYGVNKLSGASVYTHATDVKQVWDAILAALPGDENTANTDRAGGSIEFGPAVFNTSGPLVATTIRSLHVYGQGWLQGTIIQQNAQFSVGRSIFEIGVGDDDVILQGMEYDHMQIRGRIDGTHTRGGGITAWCGFSNFHDLVIESTNDTAFFLDGVSGGGGTQAFSVVLDNIQISGFNAVGTNTAYGIHFGSTTSDCDIFNSIIHQDSEAQNRGLDGIYVQGGTTRLTNCHTYFCDRNGIRFDAAGLCSFVDCLSESNGEEGLYVSGPHQVKVIGGGYYSNGQTASKANIFLNDVEEFTIAGLTMTKQRGTTVNVPRNIQVNACSYGNIHDCTLADATTDHILVADSTFVNVHDCQFRDGLTYTGVNGDTPTIAIRLAGGTTTNCKVHDNTIGGAVMGLEELASGWGGNFNEFYDNKVGSGSVELVDGTTYTSRKWGNRDLAGALLPDRRVGGRSFTTITAANDITASHGRMFTISGNTQINGLFSAGWDEGIEVMLIFTGTPTVKFNTAASAGFASFLLVGGVDFAATSSDMLTVAYNGTHWQETGRNVI